MTSLSLILNGQKLDVDADAEAPLLYVLRDTIGLNSPRYGCGAESCGACRVLVDGELAFSCTLPVAEVVGKPLTTVEGLMQEGRLHRVQQAFLTFNAAQCGYCASGIIMAATHLLESNPSPSREDVQRALENHLCRCGAHNRIIRAVLHAALLMRSESA